MALSNQITCPLRPPNHNPLGGVYGKYFLYTSPTTYSHGYFFLPFLIKGVTLSFTVQFKSKSINMAQDAIIVCILLRCIFYLPINSKNIFFSK